jgi:type I restriction enzyme S subunit
MSKIDELIQELCPDGVEYKELGAVEDSGIIKLGRGNVISKTDIVGSPGDFPVYSSSAAGSGEFGRYGKYMFDDERITWSIDGGGRFFYRTAHKYSVTNVSGWLKVIKIDILDIKFLYYVLTDIWKTKAYDYTKKAHPSIIRKEYIIPIPPLPIQQEIVRILDNFTKLEAELEAELEARKKQYDYYRNQLLSPIEKDGKWYMNGNEVELKPLGDLIISLKTGLNPRKNFMLNPPDATNYYVTVRELSGNEITFYDKTDRIDNTALALINNRSNLDKGDVLFSGTGTIGRTALVKEKPKNWNIKEGVYTIKPDQSKIVSMYLLYSLNSQFAQKQISNKTVGSPVCSIPMADLKRILIAVPPLDDQERCAAILSKFDALSNDIAIGLPAEIAARRKQYEYYRGKLLRFKNITDRAEA